MKRLIIALSFIAIINNSLPHIYSSSANAGVIKWGIKKIIGGSVGIIFSKAKDSVVEKAKQKLILYLKKHPEYIDYTSNLIKKQIDKHPKYSKRGNQILNDITLATKQKLYKTKHTKEVNTNETTK